jgi:hypothetical protein
MTSTPPAEHARPIRFLVVDETTPASGLATAGVEHACVSLHQQAVEFAREWGLASPHLRYAGRSEAQAAADGRDVDVVIALLDNADQADALGYHDETAAGVFYARVFVLTCKSAGVSWTSCASHEICEALADLSCNRWVSKPDGSEVALEVSDPVESDTYVDPRGVELSSYVLPAWFDPGAAHPFDRLGKLTKPFELGRGGYEIVQTAGSVTQVFGDREHYARSEGWRAELKATPLSRTHRRLAEGTGGT